MLRVLHVLRRYAPLRGGIERYAEAVAVGQARRGNAVTVVTLDADVVGDRAGRLPRTERIEGVRVVRLPGIGNRRFAFTTRPDLLLRELRAAEVIHHHDLRFMTGLLAVAARELRRPLIHHTHGLLFHTSWATRFKKLALRHYFGPLLTLGRAHVIASSDADRTVLQQVVPSLAARTVTFPNAIPLAPLLALPRCPDPARIVVPGRIARHKGLGDLIGALATIADLDWRLELIGIEHAEERRRLDALARALGIRDRVAFEGEFTDAMLGQRMSRSALSVFPSEHEGFGIALLEAMAAGVPVLASDIPAHRALLGPDLADRLVDARSTEALARAIGQALAEPVGVGDLSDRLRARAREFDIERLLDDIDGLYRTALLDRHRSRRPGAVSGRDRP